MDSHCFQLAQGKVPIVIFVWGHSEVLASSIFELFQTAECPRRLKVFAFEFQQQGRYAANYQEEMQRFSGLYDTFFLEQISWILADKEDLKVLRPLRDLHAQIQSPSFVEKDMPVGILLKAHPNFQLKKSWDSEVLVHTNKISHADLNSEEPIELQSATSNRFSRIDAEKGPPHIEWISIFGSYEKINISFPSWMIVGPMSNILHWIAVMYHEWPQASDEAMFFLSGLSYHLFQWYTLDIFKEMHSTQKMDRRNVKEFVARYPGYSTLITDSHLLGLDSQSAKWEIVAKYKSMRDFDTNLHEVRKDNL